MSRKSLSSVFALLSLTTTAFAQEQLNQLSLLAETAKQEHIDLEKLLAISRITAGAETPELAIEQFVAASIAANVEQALALIDPKVCPLIALEARLDHEASAHRLFDVLVQTALEGTPQMPTVGFSVFFAERDIAGIKGVEILSKQVLDDDRIVFRIKKTARSYQLNADNQIEQDLLAIRRDKRWYLFLLTGHMNWAFQMADVDLKTPDGKRIKPDDEKRILRLQNVSEKNSKPEDADFIEILGIPLQEIHAELVIQAADPVLAECHRILHAQRITQLGIESRLFRGELRTSKELKAARKPCNEGLELVAGALSRVVSQANQNLVKANYEKR